VDPKPDTRTGAEQAIKVNIGALMSARTMLGWSNRPFTFFGRTLIDLLHVVTSETGDTLYELLVQDNGTIGSEYMILINRRRVMPEHGLTMPLQTGDRIIIMPAIRFARGG